MSKMNIQKSIEIRANREKVHEIISDFHHWQKWSPWLVTEPDAKLDVREDGKFYSWEGKRVGSGEMSVENETKSRIDCDLKFLKPWKSKAKVWFDLHEDNGTTRVDWYMKSSLPFFLFFMKKKMKALIGMDYERGLSMLKEYVETGKVNSKLEFLGESAYPGCKYIGIRRTTSMDRIGEDMEKDFTELLEKVNALDQFTGEWFSQYHKYDFVNQKVEYTAGVAVKDWQEPLPNGWVKDQIPALNLQTVRHTGPYEHLGNAWSAAQAMIQAKEFRPNKSIHPLEFYRNDPADVSPEELISDVSFAVKT